jgi:hypothetical protein
VAYQTDPRMGTPQWKQIRAYWQSIRPEQCEATRCLLPGEPITYTEQRTRTSLDVGHILDRNGDERTQWTITDTRPEHAHCNRSAGASIRSTKPAPQIYIDTDW